MGKTLGLALAMTLGLSLNPNANCRTAKPSTGYSNSGRTAIMNSMRRSRT